MWVVTKLLLILCKAQKKGKLITNLYNLIRQTVFLRGYPLVCVYRAAWERLHLYHVCW